MMVSSWGRLRQVPHEVRRPAFVDEAQAALMGSPPPVLTYGKGRSYGDVCLNAQGRLIMTDMLDRFLSVDHGRGVLRAEAGVTLDQVLRVVVPHGWFVPVTPG